MTTVKASDINNSRSFNGLFLRAFNGEALSISDSARREVVLLSKREYDELERARSNAEYEAKLQRGFDAIKQGKPGIKKNMAELEAMAE